MIHDPFYRKITESLAGLSVSDGNKFERCANELLQPDYPGLVPIPGGNDAGMDGAIPDGRAEAFPLICTVGKDVLRNLKRSLISYRERGGRRRKAVVATSQELTAPRRRKLEQAARKLGFVLINVHTQADFAARVYRCPFWCRELLRVSGDPPVLSAVPDSRRPVLTSILVGREHDLAWLRETAGDLLLVGQPGSGKTFLLSVLTKEDAALFVAGRDIGQIADGVREQQPKVLLVDDAHLRCDLLDRLRHYRTTTGAEFRIVADCWPGAKDEVFQAMAITPAAIRHLDRLSRAQIVEVIRDYGIVGPTPLLHELVHQADGRPGLAATLCHLCKREEVRDVVLGDALCRDVATTFKQLVGAEAISVLACCALGGDGGMPMEAVAEELRVSLQDVHRVATHLAAGGVLVELRSGILAVRPETLRDALVRDVFYRIVPRLPIETLVVRAPNREGVIRTLIGAKHRGAQVENHRLVTLLSSYRVSDDTWQCYAEIGSEECEWVMREHPEKLKAVAQALLRHVPEEGVDRLLSAEAGVDAGDDLGWPLRVIRDWVVSAFPGTGDPVSRRRTLLEATMRWLDAGGNAAIGIRALGMALSPEFEDSETDPGNKYRYKRLFGYVSTDELSEIQQMWPGVRDRLRRMEVVDWKPLDALFRAWGYPGLRGVQVPRSTVRMMVQFAKRLLRELADIRPESLSLLYWIHIMADIFRVRIKHRLDPELLALYPIRERGGDWQLAQAEQAAAATELARHWAKEDPVVVAQRLMFWEKELRASPSRPWSRWSPLVCHEIASQTDAPADWLAALRDATADGDLAGPFLHRLVVAQPAGWDRRLVDALKDPSLRGASVAVILQMEQPPASLLDTAMRSLTGLSTMIGVLCMRRAVTEERVAALLSHESRDIAVEVALGEWHSVTPHAVRPSLLRAWRLAILRARGHLPEDVFQQDQALARDWLAARFEEDSETLSVFWADEAGVQAAFWMLSSENRLDLLLRLPAMRWAGEIISHLVGDDLAAYRALLSSHPLARFHLIPLRGEAGAVWPTQVVCRA